MDKVILLIKKYLGESGSGAIWKNLILDGM